MASPSYTVLVTGSSGHLGAALMLTLPSQGHTPLGIDILPSETTTIVGSVTDRPLIASVLSQNPSIAHVIHAATLHKPHVESHPKAAFIDTNITGTLVLLEEAAASLPPSRIKSFIFVSTTSTFGGALSPRPGRPAAWIDESVVPVPKNIYGATKCAAEDLCALAHRQSSLPVLVLRTSRFFPRPTTTRTAAPPWPTRTSRADIADVVSAVVCGMAKAADLGFGKYIVSAPPPFSRADDSGGGGRRFCGAWTRTRAPFFGRPCPGARLCLRSSDGGSSSGWTGCTTPPRRSGTSGGGPSGLLNGSSRGSGEGRIGGAS
ncbi:UDP-glucose 4-epimerase [Colletotrichum liriopes]|uniref:UDP-glucose 4-epimerase n=1 Tax=Colletotrichum liriopes TaxID=708192 RepID=A0AA37LTD2_9PEZI|nr:UDP-glucose 4-epimerase [Colletotrichum liriopes]